ncbi:MULTISPECIES: hypothetical protein [unclassified Fusibacter]|uniref:hypothetical protein n=1 Tax=unclassified Fusibacter TaxID=2624464 RepID=UPI0010123952|nr:MULTISPECIES: hypothetical protein [unclassified Fusibacter]MCK8060624.1 hypothetical protein [Fusibacter sp. A2]NPE22922.1 hypothetical protein [Fusibacter sp. A1]RXV59989.1 hypothetical protein DWB64_13840 [Fusibacter sp. A1]
MFISFILGMISLQIHWSKAPKKGKGLILPVIFLAISLLVVAALVPYSSSGTMEVFDEDGQLVSSVTTETTRDVNQNFAASTLVVFLKMNIPTFILLVIYGVVRIRMSKKTFEIEMDDFDLE